VSDSVRTWSVDCYFCKKPNPPENLSVSFRQSIYNIYRKVFTGRAMSREISRNRSLKTVGRNGTVLRSI